MEEDNVLVCRKTGKTGEDSNPANSAEHRLLTELYFAFECRKTVNMQLFNTPVGLKICSGITCTDSDQFQNKIRKISHCGSRSPKRRRT